MNWYGIELCLLRCKMLNLIENTITISSTDNKIKFRATGSAIKFDGFFKIIWLFRKTLLKEKRFYLLLTKEKLKLIKS